MRGRGLPGRGAPPRVRGGGVGGGGGGRGGGGGGGGERAPDFSQRVRRGGQRRALTVWMNKVLVGGGYEAVKDVKEGLKDGFKLQELLVALGVEVCVAGEGCLFCYCFFFVIFFSFFHLLI